MKKSNRNRRLVRLPDALPALAFAVAALLRPGEIVLWAYACALTPALLGLAATRGARLAYARQPAMRAVRGTLKVALLLQAVGAMLSLVLAWLVGRDLAGIAPWIAAGLLLNIEHLFYETVAAAGDGNGSAAVHALASGLLLAGLLLAIPRSGGDARPLWLTAFCGAGALASAAVGIASAGGLKGRMNAEIFRRAPAALIQSILYPGLALPLARYLGLGAEAACPFFLGLAILALCAAPFRRLPRESGPMNRALLIGGVAAAALWGASRLPSLPESLRSWAALAPSVAAPLLLACLCAFALYGGISLRSDPEE